MLRIALTLLAAFSAAQPAAADILSARYDAPTTRYAHGVLGDAVEWGALVLADDQGRETRLTLPQNRVFEDTEPRLIELPGEAPAVMVVESDQRLGARLALYREAGLVASTPFIGQTHRWLAPIGAADLDGDGAIELAYIDRPHLAKTIRVWRYKAGQMTELGSLPGFTNHRIGEDNIAGGIRHCGGLPEMIVADGNWREIHAVTWNGQGFVTRVLGPHSDRSSFASAMSC